MCHVSEGKSVSQMNTLCDCECGCPVILPIDDEIRRLEDQMMRGSDAVIVSSAGQFDQRRSRHPRVWLKAFVIPRTSRWSLPR